MYIHVTSWRYANAFTQTSINKESYWLMLTLLRPEARSRSHDISLVCIEKCKKLEMFISFQATALNMSRINVVLSCQLLLAFKTL